MRETKIIILTSFQSFNLSFALLFHVISTAIFKFLTWFPASPPSFPTFVVFPPRFSAFPHWFSAPAFPSYLSHSSHSSPLFSAFPSFSSPIPDFGFYRYPAQFVFFKDLFSENSCFTSQRNTPLFYNCITLSTKLLFISSMTSSLLSPKIDYLIVSRVKNV